MIEPKIPEQESQRMDALRPADARFTPTEVTRTQHQHPIAWSSLLAAMIVPMIVGVTALGFLFKNLWPAPVLPQIAVGGIVMIAAIPLLMLLGAGAWLLFARRLVARSVAKVFFVHPGMAIISRVSERMFVLAYGTDDVSPGG
jgi:hypothetical protein